MKKLEIGPGKRPVGTAEEGWVHAGYGVRWGYSALPYEDNSFSEFYASHVLEHIPWNKTAAALSEAYRVVADGGIIEIWVPNFEYIVECYHQKKMGDRWKRYNKERNFMKWVNGRIFTYGPRADNWHHSCFDAEYLNQCLEDAGFCEVHTIPERIRGAGHGPIDLGATGVKRC